MLWMLGSIIKTPLSNEPCGVAFCTVDDWQLEWVTVSSCVDPSVRQADDLLIIMRYEPRLRAGKDGDLIVSAHFGTLSRQSLHC